jgi:hypothetical protein
MLKVAETEIVVHRAYGGFHFDTEMALWLLGNRNWKTTKETKKTEGFDLVEVSYDYFLPVKDNNEIRVNQDVIDCVKALQALHPDRNDLQVYKLKVLKVEFFVGVKDCYDGYEEVQTNIVTTY